MVEQVERLEADGVRLTSGEQLPADLLVYATGYESMHRFVGDLVSRDVADRVGPVWGYGSGGAMDPGPSDRLPQAGRMIQESNARDRTLCEKVYSGDSPHDAC